MSTFAPVGSSAITTTIAGSASPVVVNLALTLADTEYTYELPAATKQFLLRVRESDASLKLAYVLGDSASTYLTVPRGCFHSQDSLTLNAPLDLYFQTPSASRTLELLYWI